MGTAQVIFVVVELPEVTACACATGSDVTESGPDRKSKWYILLKLFSFSIWRHHLPLDIKRPRINQSLFNATFNQLFYWRKPEYSLKTKLHTDVNTKALLPQKQLFCFPTYWLSAYMLLQKHFVRTKSMFILDQMHVSSVWRLYWIN
jgi:hypothetical protein